MVRTASMKSASSSSMLALLQTCKRNAPREYPRLATHKSSKPLKTVSTFMRAALWIRKSSVPPVFSETSPAAFCEDRTHLSQRDLRNIHLADGKLYLQRAIVDHIGLQNMNVLLNICHTLQVRGIRCVSHNSEYIIVRTPCLNGSK